MVVTMTAAIMSSCASKPESPATTDTPPATQAESVTEKKAEETKKDDAIDVFSGIEVSFKGTEYNSIRATFTYNGNDDFIKNNVRYVCYKGEEVISNLYTADMGTKELLKNGETAIIKASYTLDGKQYEEEKEVEIEGLCDVIEDITEYPDVRTELDNAFNDKINEYVNNYYTIDNIISSSDYIDGNKNDKWKITGIDIIPQKTFFGFWGDQSDRNINSYNTYQVLYAVNLNVEKTESSDSEDTDGYNVGDTAVFTVYAGCYTDMYSLFYDTPDKVIYSVNATTYFPSDMNYSTIREMTLEELCEEFKSDSLYGSELTDFIHEIT